MVLTARRAVEFGEGVGPQTAREAGRLAAAAAAVSICRSLLLVMTMPCTKSVIQPQIAGKAVIQGSQDMYSLVRMRNGAFGSIQAALRCTRLPANGYIAKRLHALQARSREEVQLPPLCAAYCVGVAVSEVSYRTLRCATRSTCTFCITFTGYLLTHAHTALVSHHGITRE